MAFGGGKRFQQQPGKRLKSGVDFGRPLMMDDEMTDMILHDQQHR